MATFRARASRSRWPRAGGQRDPTRRWRPSSTSAAAGRSGSTIYRPRSRRTRRRAGRPARARTDDGARSAIVIAPRARALRIDPLCGRPMSLPFEVVRAPAEMRARAEDQRRDGRRLCVVPTMGYLHAGHVSLLHAGRSQADVLIMTLFINPTQFGPGEDLARYPRDEAGDLAKARAAGVDLVFAPEPAAMYPPGYQTTVEVRDLAVPLCGRSRPGHFTGVASV